MDDNSNFKNLLIIIILIVLITGLTVLSFIPWNNSFALFTDEKEGEKTISLYYSENNNENAAKYLITSKVGKDGFTKIEVKNEDDSIQIDNKTITEYRYIGSNEKVKNNYISFNNELYRILGVFYTDNGKGSYDYRVKIIKDSSYTTDMYDDKTNNFKVSNIENILNSNFYNSLEEVYKNTIDDVLYYLGGFSNLNINSNTSYLYERKITNDNISTYFSYPHENSTSFTGKIGLLYASDYAYSANCNKNINELSNKDCKENNWLYKNENMYLLNQSINEKDDYALFINLNGDISKTKIEEKYEIYPVFYLKKDIKFISGDGTRENPYKIVE